MSEGHCSVWAGEAHTALCVKSELLFPTRRVPGAHSRLLGQAQACITAQGASVVWGIPRSLPTGSAQLAWDSQSPSFPSAQGAGPGSKAEPTGKATLRAPQARARHLGFCLDGSPVVQQDLHDSHVSIPGCTVQGSQLVLENREGGQGLGAGGCV